jgi:acyl carrier protein
MNTTVQDEAVLSPSIDDELKDIVLKVLKLQLPPSALTDASNLYELGLESLNVVELLTDIEARFDIVIDVEDLSAELFAVFGRLAEFVRSKRDATR